VSQIDFSMGNEDTTVASRQILDGQSSISGDFVPDPPTIKRALQHQKGQIVFVPLGNRYVTLTTNIKPLDNINVRKAIIAATDRNALRLTRGGPVIGDIATHYLTPGQPGFDQAGGMKGPPLDFLANPDGNPQLAAQYMKKAGYPSGKYTGNQTLLMVGDDSSSGPGAKTAEVFQSQLQKLGFKLNFRQVPNETMYSRYCNVPKANVAICPNIAWGPDFADGQVMLDPTFNGATIVPENNANQSLLNNPQVNAKLDAARKLVSPAQRADAYGAIDKQITALAPAVPWLWDKQANISSANVQGVTAKWNAAWDLSFTSIKQ
jgi:peptide/nickel transport system substrate-binding protein